MKGYPCDRTVVVQRRAVTRDCPMKQVALFASLLSVIACTHVDPNDDGRAIYGSVAATERSETNRIPDHSTSPTWTPTQPAPSASDASSLEVAGHETRQPSMRKVWKRLWWNFRHLGSEQINPYVRAGEGDLLPKERTALEDLSHAFKNVLVERWRKLKD